MDIQADTNTGLIGALVTMASVLVTYLPAMNAAIDIIAGLVAVTSGSMMCVWFYYKIKKARRDLDSVDDE